MPKTEGPRRRRGWVAKWVTIANQKGLHARAAAQFVKLATGFDADITVAKDDNVVSGLSIMGLMMLAAGPGTKLEVRATGREAGEAVSALVGLVEGRFSED